MTAESAAQNRTADRTAAELMETMPIVMQYLRTEMRSHREPSLSVPQFRVLAFLNRNPDASLSDVAEHLGVTRATASTMTNRLVRQGLIVRADDPQERRQIMLKLSQSGSDRLEEMRNRTRQKIAHLFDRLTSEELGQLSAGLTLLGQIFQIDK